MAVSGTGAALGSEPYGALLLVSALALSGKSDDAKKSLKDYLGSPLSRSRTIAAFHAQQIALASNPKWLAYNDRIVSGLRIAGMPE